MNKLNFKTFLLSVTCFLSLGAIGTSVGAIVVSSQTQTIKGDTGEQGPKGDNGEDGIGITSIEKTSSEDNIDIYTIIFSDGSTQIFQVTNGKDGAQGIQGLPGKDGKTPEIKVGENGNWFIDGVDSGVNAVGIRGDTPYIGENGNWWISEKDTGVPATGPKGDNGEEGVQGEPGKDGLTPHIGTNGNWWIGDEDTGITAQGPQGETGNGIVSIVLTNSEGYVDTYTITYTDGTKSIFKVTNGKDGAQGIQGETGKDGKATEVRVGANGNWFIDGVDSGFTAVGVDGDTPYIGENGNWWISEKDTGVPATGPKGDIGSQGEKGEDGLTPHIGENGNWWIGDIDTGLKAQGPQGETGNGIVSISKIKSDGNIDTYEIIYSNGETYNFTITNGVDGEQGIQGIPGEDGHTPIVTIGDNGNWFIDGVDSNMPAQGPQGETGNGIDRIEYTRSDGVIKYYTIYFTDGSEYEFSIEDGKSAYEIYKEYYDYDGSEEERINDLINGEFNKVTVTFDPNGGVMEEETSLQIVRGNGIAKLPVPTKEGKEFLGWFTSWSANAVQIRENDPINEDITLVAKWDTYDIQFLNDDGALLEEVVIEHGKLPSFPSDDIPTKSGLDSEKYIFIGRSDSLSLAYSDNQYNAFYVEKSSIYDNFIYEIYGNGLENELSINIIDYVGEKNEITS